MGAPSALVETWALYTLGSLIILARIVCRWRMIGIYNFKPDDYLIVLAWVTYSVMTVAAHIVGGHGDLHALTPAQREALTPEAAEPFILGTKWFCAGVATYITFIWLLKLNMLFLYQRVVNGLWVARFIVPTMGLVVATYFAIMMILFLPCRPYSRMWVVFPDQGKYCKPQSFLNMVPPLVMNLATDLLIMAIPAPVILPVKTTLARKVGLFILFFAGFFIMTAAILRVMFVVTFKTGPTAAIWSCREDVVAIVVGQAIMIRPIITKKFWSRDFASGTTTTPAKMAYYNTGGSTERSGRRVFGKPKDPFSLTAALATVQDNEPVEKLTHSSSPRSTKSSSSSAYSETASAPPKTGADVETGPVELYYHEPELSPHTQRGDYQQQHIAMQQIPNNPQPGRMVINVSREIDVENRSRDNSVHATEPQNAAGLARRPSDYLRATNNATCWNGSQSR